MSKRVLYLSYDGMTDPLGQSQVIPYLEGLSQLGHEITIISFEKKISFKSSGDKIKKRLIIAGIKWTPLIYTKNPPIISTLFDLFRLYRATIKLHKIVNFNIIHCRSYIPALIGNSLKRKYKTAFLFDMRGFWADERVDGELWNLNNPMYRFIYQFFKRKEKEFINNADHIISLTNAGKNEILKWPLLNKDVYNQITVIPCCVDRKLFDTSNITEDKKNEIRLILGIKDEDPILMYLGSIGTWYMLDEMLMFYRQMLNHAPGLKFIFLTKENPKKILNKARELNISESGLIIKWVERGNLPNYLSIANYAIYFIKPVFSKLASSPTKQAELMSMQIPIITNCGVGDSDLIVEKTNCGVLIENFTESDFEKGIQLILNSKWNLSNTQYLEDHFSLKSGVNLYAKVYNRLLETIPKN